MMTDPETRPNALFHAGFEAYSAGQLEYAVQLLGEGLAYEPTHAEANFLRGCSFYRLDRFREALADFSRAASLDPGQARYLCHKGLTHLKLGQKELAVAAARTAARVDPWANDAHRFLSMIELPGPDYRVVLALIHDIVRPKTYVEVGVADGESLCLVRPRTQVLAIDPDPQLAKPLGANQRIYRMTSDAFFERHDVREELGGKTVDLAFIDGMHRFEYALRDFMNLEHCSASTSTILVHDCYPLDAETAERERVTQFWSGDVWRLILALKKYRPDLAVNVIATPPTGLGVIRNLDPGSRIIRDNLDRICDEFLSIEFGVLEGRKPVLLNLVPNDVKGIFPLFPGARPPR